MRYNTTVCITQLATVKPNMSFGYGFRMRYFEAFMLFRSKIGIACIHPPAMGMIPT